jgi:replication-associated recombination protein RarA
VESFVWRPQCGPAVCSSTHNPVFPVSQLFLSSTLLLCLLPHPAQRSMQVRRPTKQQIATRLVQVARSEGMALEQNAAEMLVEQVHAVLRCCL